MKNFSDRLELTEYIEEKMPALFNGNIALHKFGCESIVGGCPDMMEYLKRPEVNQQASAMLIKFAPDFILLKKDEPKNGFYFIDVKHSISPTWSSNRLNIFRRKHNDETLSFDRIGVIAREAYLAYRRYYPNSIILMACPYNPKLIMAQYASKIRSLMCYSPKNQWGYDCNSCPIENGGFFDIERNTLSNGSQTPTTNVDLQSFLPIEEFFNNMGIGLNQSVLEEIKNEIQNEPLQFGENVYNGIKNSTMRELNKAGCSWIKYKVYSASGEAFYHINKDCSFLAGKKIIEYDSETDAINMGHFRPCKCISPNR